MKQTLLLTSLFLFTGIILAQKPVTVSATILDEQTNLPVSDVSITIESSNKGTSSDLSGKFSISLSDDRYKLVFYKLGYERLHLNAKEIKKNIVSLKQKDFKLPEVMISDNPFPLSKNEMVNVFDYSFIGDSILMITFRTNLSKSKLALVNEFGDTISCISLPGRPEKLFKDCLGNNHVLTATNDYQVYYNQRLKLLPPVAIDKFNNTLLPCVASSADNLYLKELIGKDIIVRGNYFNFIKNKHIVAYYLTNKTTHKKDTLAILADMETIKKSAGEDEYLAMPHGHDADGFKKECARLQDERVIFKEIYAPLFNINDKLITIFNYPDSVIEHYSPDGMRLGKSSSFSFHKTLDWKWMTIKDESRENVYSVFRHDGMYELKEVDVYSGKIINTSKLQWPFVRNIKIRNGYAYFLYEGKGEMDTNVLYRQEISHGPLK